MSLADKIRKSREVTVEAGEYAFTVRRPTDLEMLVFSQTKDPAAMFDFVTGWKGVKEMDLFPGGGPEPVAFDREACKEWLSDRIEMFGKVSDAIIGAYEAHRKTQGDAEKN